PSEVDPTVAVDPSEVDPTVTVQARHGSISIDSEAITDLGEETIKRIFDEDQTLVITDDDVTSFLGDGESTAFDNEDKAPDEDLSLHLIDHESTESIPNYRPNIGSLAANTEVQILAEGETNRLNLQGISEQDRDDDEDHTVIVRADEAASTGAKFDELTSTEGLGLREQTSTRTFAPDNYDRTLMKVAEDDAPGLFSGMKSDSGDVMTPEHAKKVFVSKVSTQRMYHYRIYAAVGFGILLVIGILGLFELQQESMNIDTSLRPLKRDPMPGVIRMLSVLEPATNVVGEIQPVVDPLTLRLVEQAEMEGDIGIILGQEVETEQKLESESEVVETQLTETQITENEVIESNSPAEQPLAAVARVTASQTNIDTITSELEKASKSQLQITISNTIRDKDRWLREGYAAYQRGDDKTALQKYGEVLEVDPGNRNALLARAAINIQNNKVEAAIRDYQKLLLANPKDSLAMASLMAVAKYSPKEAESQLKLMIRDEPDSPYLHFALANVFGAQDRWIEAQGLYFTALANNPNDPNYAYNLAVSLEHIEKPEVAIAYYERALANITNGLATFNKDVVDQRLEQLKQL
ncbi:MAG: tetratricopeptide repeat protein, partial [Proteobacteria bacterium]|nr:tetratricopeptide repeat protein [Pseudomonadota bacterium]